MVYKYFGLLATGLLVIGLLIVIKKWPHDASYSFSQHVASKKSSILYYALLFFITMPLLMLFITKWFIPEFHVSQWFGGLTLVSATAQCICTLIPETGESKSFYHRFFAGVSAVLLIPASLLLSLQGNIDLTNKILLWLGIIVMLCIAFVVAKSGGKHGQFILLQSAYFAAFFVPLMFISYF